MIQPKIQVTDRFHKVNQFLKDLAADLEQSAAADLVDHLNRTAGHGDVFYVAGDTAAYSAIARQQPTVLPFVDKGVYGVRVVCAIDVAKEEFGGARKAGKSTIQNAARMFRCDTSGSVRRIAGRYT